MPVTVAAPSGPDNVRDMSNVIRMKRIGAGVYEYHGERGLYVAERDDLYLDGDWRLTYPDGDQGVAAGLWECRLWIDHHESEGA